MAQSVVARVGSPDGGRPLRARLLCERSFASLTDAHELLHKEAVPFQFAGRQCWRWHLFLDEPIDATETCAISCAITTLMSSGDSKESQLIRQATDTLMSLQLPNGGWTSWVSALDDTSTKELEEPLVIDTYFALQALRLVERTECEHYERGLDWFRRAHNAATGGWGFFVGGPARTLPTTMAIRTLAALSRHMSPVQRDVVDRGTAWLLRLQEEGPDAGWGQGPGLPSSAVHTAHALIALTAAGFDKYSRPVSQGREWLLEHRDDRSATIDHYVTPGRSSSGAPCASRAINHINFADGIIVQGALAAGANLLDPPILSLVHDLVESKQPEGYWKCLHCPKDRPIYAIMDAGLALRAFANDVKRNEDILDVAERLQDQENRLADVTAALVRIEELVGKVSGRVDRQQAGLVALTPLMWTTRQVVRYPLLAVLLVLTLAAYAVAAFTVESRYRLYALVTAVLFTATTTITFWGHSYRERRRSA